MEGKLTGRAVPGCLYLRWEELAPFAEDCLEMDAFSIALGADLLKNYLSLSHRLAPNVTAHVIGMHLEYANAGLVESHFVPVRHGTKPGTKSAHAPKSLRPTPSRPKPF